MREFALVDVVGCHGDSLRGDHFQNEVSYDDDQ